MMKWWTLVLLLFSMISSITKSYILRVSQPIFQKSRLSPLFGFSLLRKIAKTTLLSTDEDSAPYTMMNAALDEGSTITDEEPYEIGVQRSLSKPQTLVTEASKLANSGKKARAVLTARLVSWILKRIIHSRTTYATGLNVEVHAHSNRHLLAGYINTVELRFDSIAFGQLFVTGGGKLVIEGLALKMKSFLFDNYNSLRRPYTIHGDFQLTQENIVNSKLIRGLIQLLMNTIIERALREVCCKRLYLYLNSMYRRTECWR